MERTISLARHAVRTSPHADLDSSREFYANLLGLNVCGEKPGQFVQFAVGNAAACLDLADGEEPPAAIFAVQGLEQLCQRLEDAGASLARSSEEGVGDYVVVHDPDGHELVLSVPKPDGLIRATTTMTTPTRTDRTRRPSLQSRARRSTLVRESVDGLVGENPMDVEV